MARKALRTAFFFTQSAATRFTASIFLFLNRVFPRRAFEGLEPYMAKVLSTVLRGLGPSNGARLLGSFCAPHGVFGRHSQSYKLKFHLGQLLLPVLRRNSGDCT